MPPERPGPVTWSTLLTLLTTSMPFELLETIRWTPGGGWFLLDRHLARADASARYFQIAFPAGAVHAALESAVRSADGPLRVRLLVGPAGTVRVETASLAPPAGVTHVRLAKEPIDPTDDFLFHKTTNRAVYDRARRPDCDDVVLWNPAREITETTIANLVVDIDGRRVTPPVACGLLPGTMRAELLATGEVIEQRVTVEQLRGAAQFWLVNSVRGWCTASLEAD
jgi:branched-subunit amino acid aminotransferase/4-amino-4-deoxychorismate lyase